MKEGLVHQRANSRFALLRRDYLAICENLCAAVMLDVMEGLTRMRMLNAEHRVGHDLPVPEDEVVWIRMSQRWFFEHLGGAFARSALRTGLNKLLEKGFIETRANPERKWDRTTEYRFCVDVVETALADLPVQPGDDRPQGQGDDRPQGADDRPPHARASDGRKDTVKRQHLVEGVWEHYVKVFEATRQTLNPTRRRLIQEALKVRSVEECKRAIDGLRVSPHHNGDNEQRAKYLDIRYAFKGNVQRGESPEERIDKMIALAAKISPNGGGHLSGSDAKVQRLLDAVRHTVQTGGERARGIEAKASLEAMGYEVKREGERVWLVT